MYLCLYVCTDDGWDKLVSFYVFLWCYCCLITILFIFHQSISGEKYIIGSAQHDSRLLHIKSSCILPVEIYSSVPPSEINHTNYNEIYVTTLQGVENEYQIDHNVFHGYFNQTFYAYIPTSVFYNTQSEFNRKREFVFPVSVDEEKGEIKMYEFEIDCPEEPVPFWK